MNDTAPSAFDLLVAEAAIRIGYARVFAGAQNLERQIDALNGARCSRVFADKKFGKNALRPGPMACHAFLAGGDTLVVASLDLYGRSLQVLISMVSDLRKRSIGFTLLYGNLNTSVPEGSARLPVFNALAEFIRELLIIGTDEGMAAAHTPSAGSADTQSLPPSRSSEPPRDMLPNPKNSIASTTGSSVPVPASSTTTSLTCKNPAPAAASRTSSVPADRYRRNRDQSSPQVSLQETGRSRGSRWQLSG